MKYLSFLLVCFGLVYFANAQEEITVTSLSIDIPDDPALKNLVWHRWETKNFVIVSIDKEQGLWLYKNVEQMKVWIFQRWGFPDFDFPKRVYSRELGLEPGCMILCVPNKELMRKIWKKDKSYVETRKDSQGNISLNFVIVVLEQPPLYSLSKPLTVACLRELENKLQPLELNPVLVRGIATLNETIPQIRERIKWVGDKYQADEKLFFSKSLLTMEDKDLQGISSDMEYLFDSQAAILCLLLRKEFGQDKFMSFVCQSRKGADLEASLRSIYKFESTDAFDRTFKRYMRYLADDVKNSRTPDRYLMVSEN